MTNQQQSALFAIVDLAQGYGTATPAQIKKVADECGMEAWELEGFYFDATETAGEDCFDSGCNGCEECTDFK